MFFFLFFEIYSKTLETNSFLILGYKMAQDFFIIALYPKNFGFASFQTELNAFKVSATMV